MVRYAKGAEVGLLDPAELSERLSAVLRTAMPWLVTISEAEASVPEREGKWSAKQVIGHLVDSAVNNLGRIVRLEIEAGQSLPGYQQMEWVDLEHYAEREWSQVLALWFALNEHVAWTIKHVERSRLANRGVVAEEPLTLGFLIEGLCCAYGASPASDAGVAGRCGLTTEWVNRSGRCRCLMDLVERTGRTLKRKNDDATECTGVR